MVRPECVEDFGDNSVRVKPGLRIHRRRGVMIDEYVGQDHASYLEARALERATIRQKLENMGAESANGAFLDGHEQLVAARKPHDHIGVERFGETRIRDRGRNAVRRKNFSSLQTFGEARSKREQ